MDFSVYDYVATPMVFVEIGADGVPRFNGTNQAYLDMSGIHVGYATAMEVFPGRLGRRLYQRHIEVIRTRKPLTYTLLYNYPNGERELLTTLLPVLDDQGAVTHIIGTMIEVTENEADRAKRLADEAAQIEALREMEQFMGMAAHDLRAPLRHVSMISTMLKNDMKDEDDANLELLDMLENVSASGGDVISDVVHYARSVSAGVSIARVDFRQLCDALVVFLDPLSKHNFSCDRAMLETDEPALKIALRNLMENAIKHSGTEVADMELSVSQFDDTFLEVTVRDNGKGFTDPSLAFLDGGDFRNEHGFGLLGVRRIIRARGGDIRAIQPEAGTGALVKFTLPGRVIAERSGTR